MVQDCCRHFLSFLCYNIITIDLCCTDQSGDVANCSINVLQAVFNKDLLKQGSRFSVATCMLYGTCLGTMLQKRQNTAAQPVQPDGMVAVIEDNFKER